MHTDMHAYTHTLTYTYVHIHADRHTHTYCCTRAVALEFTLSTSLHGAYVQVGLCRWLGFASRVIGVVCEMADLKAGRWLSVCHYKCRASQILTSYSFPQSGECMSYLSRLLRGMPRRLAKCKANGYGPCGE